MKRRWLLCVLAVPAAAQSFALFMVNGGGGVTPPGGPHVGPGDVQTTLRFMAPVPTAPRPAARR
jgi:hypothetical protein